MQLEEFNALPAPEAADLVRACADVERWVEEVVAARPFATVADAVAAAETAADPGPTPRSTPRSRGTRASASERRARRPMRRCPAPSRPVSPTPVPSSSSVSPPATVPTRSARPRLPDPGGRAHAGEILALLEQRLHSTPEQERANAARNLREIAALRLRGMVSS